MVYVPSYNPVVVYGAPIYPYPPIYYPPPGYYAAGMAIAFGVGIAIGTAWHGGWGYGCGWGRSYNNNNIAINRNNNFVNNSKNFQGGNRNQINGGNNWQHNPQHRGGAPYSDRATANRYGGSARGDSMQNRQASARQNQARQQGGAGTRGGASAATADRGANRNAGASNRSIRRLVPRIAGPIRMPMRTSVAVPLPEPWIAEAAGHLLLGRVLVAVIAWAIAAYRVHPVREVAAVPLAVAAAPRLAPAVREVPRASAAADAAVVVVADADKESTMEMNAMIPKILKTTAQILFVPLLACIMPIASSAFSQQATASPSKAATQKSFATPQEAVDTLIKAAGDYDVPALLEMSVHPERISSPRPIRYTTRTTSSRSLLRP